MNSLFLIIHMIRGEVKVFFSAMHNYEQNGGAPKVIRRWGDKGLTV